uniref:Uncharacterized protein n=1 Tax=Angiostrongylus cantonensis TaxID=6313 RepID=A0A0K0D0E4_ANGCA
MFGFPHRFLANYFEFYDFRLRSMKEEFADEGYSWATKTSCATDTEQSLLVANRIKQEWSCEQTRQVICIPISRHDKPQNRHQPIVFDHFICMRIGLNTEYNVQKLMALLVSSCEISPYQFLHCCY